MKPALLIAASLFSLTGTTDYVLSILRGKTKPHRTTRLVLFIVAIVNLVGSLAAHAQGGILLLALFFFGRSLLLALLSIKHGVGGTSRLDIVCGVVALLGIVAWLATGDGVWALIFAILADAFAYVSAIIKTWKLPKSEAPLLYWMEGIAAILAIVHDGLLLNTIFQLYIILSCITMLVCIYRPTFGRERIST
jgi:hypothetical protein